jgi:hypothetical protein
MLKSPRGLGLFLIFLFLTGCGGGEGDSGESTNRSSAAPADTLALAWAAPAQRADGEALSLSEIASFTIYFGTTSGDYPYSVALDDPTATDVAISNLPSGIYHVVMTTTDTSGLESGFSEEVAVEVHDSLEEAPAPASGLYTENGKDLACKSESRAKRPHGTGSFVNSFGNGSGTSGWARQDDAATLASLCASDAQPTPPQANNGSPTNNKTSLGNSKKNKPKKDKKSSSGKAKKTKPKKDIKSSSGKAKKDKPKKDIKSSSGKAKKNEPKKDIKSSSGKAKKTKPKQANKSSKVKAKKDKKKKSGKQAKKN